MKGYKRSFVLVLAFAMCFAACTRLTDSPLPDPTPSVSVPPSGIDIDESPSAVIPSVSVTETPEPSLDVTGNWEPNEISVSEITYSQTFKSGGNEVLYANSSFPQTGITVIDEYYHNLRDQTEQLCRQLAGEAEQFNSSLGVSYRYNAGYKILLNMGGYFSVQRIVDLEQGGAHGDTVISCDTFRVSDGKRLVLDDFFSVSQQEYTERLMVTMREFITTNKDRLRSDAEETISAVFPYENFSITEDGLRFTFQLYTIAAYTEGIVEVDVPWNAISDILVMP